MKIQLNPILLCMPAKTCDMTDSKVEVYTGLSQVLFTRAELSFLSGWGTTLLHISFDLKIAGSFTMLS